MNIWVNWLIKLEQKNLYNRMEWAGAFGDVGTLIPFVVACIAIVKVEPLGLLLMFGLALTASGFYYRTPLPIQPMKAIGAQPLPEASAPRGSVCIRPHHGTFLASCRRYRGYNG